MKRMLSILVLSLMLVSICTGCSSLERSVKDVKSDLGGGLNRIVTVYTADGEVLKQYTGKIDFEPTEGGIVKFDFKGKRYLYYNCFVEAIEVDE